MPTDQLNLTYDGPDDVFVDPTTKLEWTVGAKHQVSAEDAHRLAAAHANWIYTPVVQLKEDKGDKH